MGGAEEPSWSEISNAPDSLSKRAQRVNRAAFVVLCVAVGMGFLVALLANKDKDKAPGVSGNPTTNRSSPIGWLAVFGSIVVFGSYGIMMKSPNVQDKKVDTMVFQCYSSVGIAGVSAMVLTYAPWHFSWWGVAGAAMLVLIQVFAFNAISALGYAVAPAIWAGLTIVVSFLWGSIKFGEHVESMAGAIASLVLLVAGIVGIASCQTDLPYKIAAALGVSEQGPHLPEEQREGDPEQSRTAALIDGADVQFEGAATLADDANGPALDKASGAIFCVAVGLLNGSLMVPFKYLSEELPKDAPPIAYLGSFAVGVLITTPIFFVFYFYFPIREAPKWHFDAASIPGVVTGCLWAIGNFCATYATQYLGNTVGFPLTQTCIIFNGLWGILFYGEISGKPKIVLFSICCLVIVAASVLLTIAKGS